jgi:very-short-patch-repair endonuclease
MKYDSLNDKEKEKIINKLYIKEKKSFALIAEELSTYANKVRRDAVKFKIKIRDKSDAQKNAINSGITDHPTKGKKRSQEVKDKIGLSVMSVWDNMSDSEFKSRQNKAREQWLKMDDEQKQNIIKLANEAVRSSSKTGSKLEQYLLSGLIKNGIKVDFHKEHNLLNTKLQIDLFLPEINIAIEVDGPSHFLPVWGDDALKRNIKYDNKKNGLLLGKGCVIIRVKQTKDFSPSRAGIILDKILSNIEEIRKKTTGIKNKIIEIGDN